MQKLFTRGMTKLKNEQGSIMLLTVFLVLFISIFFAGMVEFGRIMIVREQLQTATDSAALAGAGSGTHRFVKINVVTDRGQYTSCCGGGKECEPCCRNCSTVTINGIIGNEKELIDEGEWQNFCVPPCDCGGDDCWFELVERDVMYDTHSAGWGTNPQEITNTRNDLTNATRQSLAESCYPYQGTIYSILRNRDLKQMASIISNQSIFLLYWMNAGGYNVNCEEECYRSYYDSCYECRKWKEKGKSLYSSKLVPKKDFVNKIINTMNKMELANCNEIEKLDEQYTKNAGEFFNANLPKHAEDAGIQKIKVYGFESHNDPVKSKYYPSVVVYATAKIKTIFPQWFNGDFQTTTCAQGSTSYRDPEAQKAQGNHFHGPIKGGKWNSVPENACWVDW